MSKAALVFWSGTGNTEAMANAVEAGIKAGGAEVEVFQAADFDSSKVAEFDGIAFGCPSMGAEQLEESEMQPMFDDVKDRLSGKKVVLFGSYGWGDGEWMRTWEDDCADAGADRVADSVICNETPDDEAKAECKALGEALAKAL
ncbi:flavodoxin [Pseudoramibacter alactolyticus]|uniref:flavodoxin n=1 Tax=Pseudoramibacter alactolyticus TaxID=113287 RepID=UPI0028E75D2B|nr:flavodoxin [Pseudoramibacter alactolyticus]